MKLVDLKINNFMPYKGEQLVEFPQHDVQNVMLLFGDNMRGKTSFLNSIRWGFYGVALGRHLRNIPRKNLVNMDAAADGDWLMSVALRFSHNEHDYELRRQIEKKAHVSEPKNDSDFDETVMLRINGEVITADKIINEVNQVIPEEISRFFLFDGELLQEYENLLLDESEQGEKIKEHIEQVLGVPALIHAREELETLLKTARQIQTKDAKQNQEAQQFVEQQKQLEALLASYEKDQADLLKQREKTQNEIDLIDDQLKNTEAVQRKKIELEGLKGAKKEVEKIQKNYLEEERILLKAVWKDVLFISSSPILEDLRKRRDNIQGAFTKKATLADRIAELKKSLNDTTCHTCKQNIPQEKINAIQEAIEAASAEHEFLDVNPQDLSELNIKIDKLTKIQSQNEGARIIELCNKFRQSEIELVRVDSRLEEINEEIRGYDTDQIMRQREKKESLSIHKAKLDNDLQDLKHKINKNNQDQDHYAALISKSAGAEGQLSTRRVKLYKDLQKIFSEGIGVLRDSLRSDVQSFASQAFAELTTEKSYSGLEINKNYGLSILDHANRKVMERSAGAEQIVALALIDGLNRTARTSGPIVMDTPLGRLDPKHRNNVLKYLPKMAEQVMLLVHEGEIDPNRDLSIFAERIGARYKIERVSSTESRIKREM